MKIEYVGRNCEVSDNVREHAEKKLSKATKFLGDPIEARLTFELEGHRHHVEVHLSHRHGVIDAIEEGGSWLDSVKAVLDKVERQARRGRKKHIDRRRRSPRSAGGVVEAWPVDVLERASFAQGTGAETSRAVTVPRVVKSSLIQIKPMSLDEAALQLETSEHDFVVFRDADTDEVNVLYRRKDSHYGLIAPEV